MNLSPIATAVRRVSSLAPLVRSGTLAAVAVMACGLSAGQAHATELPRHETAASLNADVQKHAVVVDSLADGLQAILTVNLSKLDSAEAAKVLKHMAAATLASAPDSPMNEVNARFAEVAVHDGYAVAIEQIRVWSDAQVTKAMNAGAPAEKVDLLVAQAEQARQRVEEAVVRAQLRDLANSKATPAELQAQANDALAKDSITPAEVNSEALDPALDLEGSLMKKLAIVDEMATAINGGDPNLFRTGESQRDVAIRYSMWVEHDNDIASETAVRDVAEMALASKSPDENAARLTALLTQIDSVNSAMREIRKTLTTSNVDAGFNKARAIVISLQHAYQNVPHDMSPGPAP